MVSSPLDTNAETNYGEFVGPGGECVSIKKLYQNFLKMKALHFNLQRGKTQTGSQVQGHLQS